MQRTNNKFPRALSVSKGPHDWELAGQPALARKHRNAKSLCLWHSNLPPPVHTLVPWSSINHTGFGLNSNLQTKWSWSHSFWCRNGLFVVGDSSFQFRQSVCSCEDRSLCFGFPKFWIIRCSRLLRVSQRFSDCSPRVEFWSLRRTLKF